jgi:hypothetical protein
LFPLGPETDARAVLHSLGGPFNHTGRWKEPLRIALRRLLGNDKQDTSWYDVLVLRILIAPFTLRRMSNSTWGGSWVIERTVTRPAVQVLEPYADQFSEKAAKNKFRRTKNEKTSEAKLIDRADKQRFFAWSPIYEDLLHAKVDLFNESKKGMQLMEEIIATKFRESELTGRMKRFIAFVKDVNSRGDRFIVVSDRLFPLVLAFYV